MLTRLDQHSPAARLARRSVGRNYETFIANWKSGWRLEYDRTNGWDPPGLREHKDLWGARGGPHARSQSGRIKPRPRPPRVRRRPSRAPQRIMLPRLAAPWITIKYPRSPVALGASVRWYELQIHTGPKLRRRSRAAAADTRPRHEMGRGMRPQAPPKGESGTFIALPDARTAVVCRPEHLFPVRKCHLSDGIRLHARPEERRTNALSTPLSAPPQLGGSVATEPKVRFKVPDTSTAGLNAKRTHQVPGR
jgi:hypothetical protein